MRKVFVIITVIALILSLVGTGVLVYIESHTPVETSTKDLPL